MNLQPNSLLQGGKYKIEKVLGQGGFGVTYWAIQTGLNRKVAIKEFFMKDYCDRNVETSKVTVGSQGFCELIARFRQKFIKEAQMIASFKHSNIVRIIDIFEENDTAYYVMEYIGGGSLKERAEGKGISEKEAVDYILQIAHALDYIHQKKIAHLDIKPSNILIDEDNTAVLIDFGISKHYDDTGSQTTTSPIGRSKGFAPLEQYQQGGMTEFSACTDIYSLGATLYFLLSGKVPPEASEIYEDGLPDLPTIHPKIYNAIEKSMQPRRKARPQNIEDFLALLPVASESKTITAGKPEIEAKDETTVISLPFSPSFSEKETECFVSQPQVQESEIIVPPMIDLGLSVKWAAWNVGANAPEEYGILCGWADKTGRKTSIDEYDYPTVKPPHNICGDSYYDIACATWGEKWRLPTQSEFQELRDRCKWNYISYRNIKGYKIIGLNGNAIFLPASGRRNGTSSFGQGEYGNYWTGTLCDNSSTYAYLFAFDSITRGLTYGFRAAGRSIRAVAEK